MQQRLLFMVVFVWFCFDVGCVSSHLEFSRCVSDVGLGFKDVLASEKEIVFVLLICSFLVALLSLGWLFLQALRVQNISPARSSYFTLQHITLVPENLDVYSRITSLRFADAPYGHLSWGMEILTSDFTNIWRDGVINSLSVFNFQR